MTEAIERAAVLRNSLKAKKHQRVASFSEAETFCLRSLLLDETRNGTSDGATDRNEASSQPLQDHNLSDDVLFSVPPASVLSGTKAELPAHHKPARRPSNLALWRAREKGVTYKAFIKQAVQESDPLEGTEIQTDLIDKSDNPDEADHPEESGIDDTASDVEVRPETKSDMSTASSWDEEDHQDNFDTWEVRKRMSQSSYSSYPGLTFFRPMSYKSTRFSGTNMQRISDSIFLGEVSRWNLL